ncbi:MAG: GTPase-activating protein [Desulfuromonadales bacterium]|nr:GTPase-activating protein [Desulfuromonadales bacterium]
MAMYFLPKVNPLYEQISANKTFLPNILEKLGKGHFTGYLSHSAQNSESYCIFAKGKLICAVSTEGKRDKTGFEAIILLFDRILSSGGEINVYSMTPDLAMCAHALLLGTKLLNGDEVRQVDIKNVFARLKGQDMNGVVRFYTAERSAMMFYKDGLPIGFYHDSIRTIETTPDEARKVAALPGARVEVCSTKTIEELMLYDLLQMVNLHKLWEAAVEKRASTQPRQHSSPEKMAAVPSIAIMEPGSEKLAELVEDLKEVAMAYLSKEGRVLIEKCIREAGGNSILLDEDKTEALLKRIEDETRVIDSDARIEEMVDLMRSEIVGRLAV